MFYIPDFSHATQIFFFKYLSSMTVCKAVTETKGNILVEPTRQRQHILDWLKHSLFAIQSNTCNFIVLTSLVLIYNVEIKKSKEKHGKRRCVQSFDWYYM